MFYFTQFQASQLVRFNCKYNLRKMNEWAKNRHDFKRYKLSKNLNGKMFCVVRFIRVCLEDLNKGYLNSKSRVHCTEMFTVFPQIVFGETILFWIWKFKKIQIVAANFNFLHNELFKRGNYSRAKLYGEIWYPVY